MLTLATLRVGRQLAGAELADDRLERLLGLAELDPGHGERQVGLAAVADVLDDHVDVDAGVGQRVEDGPGDARPVRDGHDRDLGDVPVVGEAADLVALLHERVLLDERARRVLERAQDLDDDVVDPAELDRADLHDLGALVGELEHLLVADDGQLAGRRHEPRVGRVDAPHVGEDLAAVGAQGGRQGDRRRVAAAAAERGHLLVGGGPRALALEPGDDDDLAALELLAHAGAARCRRCAPGRRCRRW